MLAALQDGNSNSREDIGSTGNSNSREAVGSMRKNRIREMLKSAETGKLSAAVETAGMRKMPVALETGVIEERVVPEMAEDMAVLGIAEVTVVVIIMPIIVCRISSDSCLDRVSH